MAGRGLLEVVEQIVGAARKPLDSAAAKAAEEAARRAAKPITRAPKPGEKLVIPNIKIVQKERLDPQGYGNIGLSRPIEAYTPQVTPTNQPLTSKKTVTLEDLENQYLLPLYWDRTSGDGILTGVGDLPLQRGYLLEGGADFMRGPAAQADGAIVASSKPIISRLASAAGKVPEDAPVNAIMLSMAPTGVDFATFPARAAADLLQQSKMLKSQVRDFDEVMQAQVPSWPGLMAEDLDGFLLNTGAENRKAFLSYVDSSAAQKAGVPTDVAAAARYAVTDPAQRTIPSNYGGMTIGRIDMQNPIIENPSVPHSTYPAQLRGEYVGGLEFPMHQSLLFPKSFADYATRRDKHGKPLTSQNMVRALGTELPLQKVTPEMVDGYMLMLEDARRRGLLD